MHTILKVLLLVTLIVGSVVAADAGPPATDDTGCLLCPEGGASDAQEFCQQLRQACLEEYEREQLLKQQEGVQQQVDN